MVVTPEQCDFVFIYQHLRICCDNQKLIPYDDLVLVVDVRESKWCHALMWLFGGNVGIVFSVIFLEWAQCLDALCRCGCLM